jgi:voltage-gated potassium channel
VSESVQRFEGSVRSSDNLRKLANFERRIYLPLVLSAILPIVTAASRSADDSWVSVVVNVVAWLVFVADLAVHVHYVRRYLATRVGVFDLVVVVVTAPWFLIPGWGGSQILVVARLARLARLLFVSKTARRAMDRLGKVGIFALGMLLFCSWMAYDAEHATNDGFATVADALWWGIVTLTTVGYGDIVPDTEKGRIAGTFLMLTGIATLGLISGTLASFFRVTPAGTAESDAAPPADDQPSEGEQGSVAAVVAELTAMREQLATLERRLVPTGEPPSSA